MIKGLAGFGSKMLSGMRNAGMGKGAIYGGAVSGVTGENILEGAFLGAAGAGIGGALGSRWGDRVGARRTSKMKTIEGRVARPGKRGESYGFGQRTTGNFAGGSTWNDERSSLGFGARTTSPMGPNPARLQMGFSGKQSAYMASVKMSTLGAAAGAMIGHSMQDKSSNMISSNNSVGMGFGSQMGMLGWA